MLHHNNPFNPFCNDVSLSLSLSLSVSLPLSLSFSLATMGAMRQSSVSTTLSAHWLLFAADHKEVKR